MKSKKTKGSSQPAAYPTLAARPPASNPPSDLRAAFAAAAAKAAAPKSRRRKDDLKSRTMTFPPAVDTMLRELEQHASASLDRSVGCTAVVRAALAIVDRNQLTQELLEQIEAEHLAGEVYRGGRRRT